jgi:chromatin segregation and condensation protein Rec8/ScpA/Scc1 (kleisin family)
MIAEVFPEYDPSPQIILVNVSYVTPPLAPPMHATGIAEEPETKELVLKLKGEFGEPQEIYPEDELPEEVSVVKGHRASIRRSTKQEKEEFAKQALKEEASIRRTSLVQNVRC